MNDKDEGIQAISIGLIVAYFLLNTNRVLKSIEVCKECLTIFKEKAGIIDEKLATSLHKRVSLIMSHAFRAIKDNTNAIKHTENVLQIYRESGEKLAERKSVTEREKLPVTETLELCIAYLANMTRRGNISKNHLRSRKKLVTETEKAPVMENLALCIDQLANMTRRGNI